MYLAEKGPDRFAIKQIERRFMKGSGIVEDAVMKDLRHPNIIQVFEVVGDPDKDCFNIPP